MSEPATPTAVAETLRAPELHRPTLPTTLPTLLVEGLEPPSVASPHVGRSDEPDLQIHEQIGAGGMGRILSAHQRSLRREVAIKTLHAGVVSSGALPALLHEAVVTGSLEHPSIVPVHGLGADAHGRPLLVMKRIEGCSWRALLDDPAHPGWAHVGAEGDRLDTNLEILMQVCNALHFAHGRGFAHRDLKPENVMVGAFGEVYLLDWGIATRIPSVAEPTVVGTPAYMAPEMARGAPEVIDARTDVYLLGATLHEVLTGLLRHEGTTLEALVVQAAESRPYTYPKSVPAELAALCNRATSRSPTDRPESALAFRRALAEHRRHRAVIALTEAAQAKLDAAAGAPASRVGALLTEARFGFQEALRAWPENKPARRGLDAGLARMIEHDLARGDVAGARALLDELDTPDEKLVAKIVAAEAELARKAEEDSRLRALAHDHDPSVGARSRLQAIVASTIGASLLSFLVLFTSGEATYTTIVSFAVALIVLFVIVVAIARKSLLRNAYGRSLVGLSGVIVVGLLVDRLVGRHLGVPVQSVLAHELWLMGMIAAAGAVTVARWLWWLAGAYAVGGVIGTLWPQTTIGVLSALVAVGATVCVVVLRRQARDVPKH